MSVGTHCSDILPPKSATPMISRRAPAATASAGESVGSFKSTLQFGNVTWAIHRSGLQ